MKHKRINLTLFVNFKHEQKGFRYCLLLWYNTCEQLQTSENNFFRTYYVL